MPSMRPSTLETLGLGTVLAIFKNGDLPMNAGLLVDKIFGKKGERGAMVISGAGGVVGAGKVMQFASRLYKYDIPIIALDMPGSPDGLGKQYPGLVKAFGKPEADNILRNVIRLSYDGNKLPESLKKYRPVFLLEAIPEIAELKKAHYALFRKEYPGIHIYSVTSGFPASILGVKIAHPAFPHEINKFFEVVEDEPSDITKLLWSLGLIPIQVSDHWSFVLDVFFCGVMLAGLRYSEQTNMPFWKVDKVIRKMLGPNPIRAHDAIGAKGSSFLTWSCLHHLSVEYGPLFEPPASLVEHKDSGQNFYPPDHFRPLVDWKLTVEDQAMAEIFVLGALFQMTSIMIKEQRSHLSTMNAIGEQCAQFTRGGLALARELGEKKVISLVREYHKLHPASAETRWYPEVFKKMTGLDWQQLYVNAEHDGTHGVITISRESYNRDVDDELNRAIDWLKKNNIDRVILTSDFHVSTQMVGADTNEFFPAIMEKKEGERIAEKWSATARRMNDEFQVSVGFVNGKRCMGGMLELMMHCHYLIAPEDTVFAMPEVTLPVVPGMEGCHWALRKATREDRKRILKMLLDGQQVRASDTLGWLTDYTGSLSDCIRKTWSLVSETTKKSPVRRPVEKRILDLPFDELDLPALMDTDAVEARNAIMECVRASCGTTLNNALNIQASLSAAFMISKSCRRGRVGKEFDKVMTS